MTDESPLELIEVSLLGLPLDIQVKASEHQDGLRREFRMLVEEGQADAGSVPGRLISLAADLDRRFQAFGAAGRAEIEAAIARGDATVDLRFAVPREIGSAARQFARLLEEADEYCSAGEHLLTLCTPSDVVSYRTWVLGELVRQAQDEAATPWPEYKALAEERDQASG